MEANNGQESKTYHTRIDPSGRLFLPAALRERTHIKSGDEVVLIERPDGLEIKTMAQALREAQEYFCRVIPRKVNLVEELIAERKAEAARE